MSQPPMKSPLEHLQHQWPADGQKRQKVHRLVSKRARVTLPEGRAQEQLVRDLRDALGLTQLYWSDVDRALWIVAQNALARNPGRINVRLTPPENRDIVRAIEFSKQLARVLEALIHRRPEGEVPPVTKE